MGPTQPPIQWVPGAISLGVKRPGREADHSPPSSAVVKECVELYLHSPNTPPWRDTQLKHRDNFTFNFQQMSIGYLNRIPLLRNPVKFRASLPAVLKLPVHYQRVKLVETNTRFVFTGNCPVGVP
jgi:hypothetical protein